MTAIILIAAYYLLPLDRLSGVSLGVSLAFGLLALTAIADYQVRAIIRHPHSAVRAIEALAITVPLFLLL
ncbi:MAG: two pore domain potassium channel family protein, partial [Geminicoccaceae bacterium]